MNFDEFIKLQHELQGAYLYNRIALRALESVDTSGLTEIELKKFELQKKHFDTKKNDIVNSVIYDEVRIQINERLGFVVPVDFAMWVFVGKDYDQKELRTTMSKIVYRDLGYRLKTIKPGLIDRPVYSNYPSVELKERFGIEGIFFNSIDYMESFKNYFGR